MAKPNSRMPEEMQIAVEAEHGIGDAFYTWVGPDMLWPHLICLCGEKFNGMTWEEAGAELDSHIERTKR